MKEKFKKWYLNQLKINMPLFILIHLIILAIVIGSINEIFYN